jgi:hypothetical protein
VTIIAASFPLLKHIILLILDNLKIGAYFADSWTGKYGKFLDWILNSISYKGSVQYYRRKAGKEITRNKVSGT